MPLLRRPSDFDRNQILSAAARARAARKRHKAIALYRWVIAVEPRNAELHAKLAPLLAEDGQDFDAWLSYQVAAQYWVRQGLLDRAIDIYREASHYLSREYRVWERIAVLQCRRGLSREAIETLSGGSRHFRSRWARPQAIHLLRRAREIDDWNFEVVLDLACLLGSVGQREEAFLLLDRLAEFCLSSDLLRVRAAQLRLTKSPASAWRYLALAFRLATRRRPGAVTPPLPGAEGEAVGAQVTLLRPRIESRASRRSAGRS